MEIIRTPEFDHLLNKLPQNEQRLYLVQEKRFKQDWRDPRLHVKKVRDLEHAFSFRVTRRYRVFFYFQSTERTIFFDIGHRNDIYR